MEFFVALFVLTSLPIFFGFRQFIEYGSFSHKLWGTWEKLATFMFLSYVILFATIGKENLYDLAIHTRESTKFVEFFMMPSLGFAIAMFPRIAAEYSENYMHLAATRTLTTVAVVGWLEITWLFSILVF